MDELCDLRREAKVKQGTGYRLTRQVIIRLIKESETRYTSILSKFLNRRYDLVQDGHTHSLTY